MELKDIELKSQEVKEILSSMPSWLIRWGITLAGGIVLLILLASWIIKYPDVVPAKVTITTYNPPARIIARNSGRLQLLVKDNQHVKQGQYVAVIENSTDFRKVLDVQNDLNKLNNFLITEEITLPDSNFPEDANLAEMQPDYISLLKSLKEYRQFIAMDIQAQRIFHLQKRVKHYEEMAIQLKHEETLANREVDISSNRLKVDSLLVSTGTLAPLDKNNSEYLYIQNAKGLEIIKSAVIQNNIKITELHSEIAELLISTKDNRNKLKNTIEQAYKNLSAKIMLWEQSYVMKSPIDGNISFFSYWSNNHYAKQDDEVMIVVPAESEIFGNVLMSLSGSGKVRENQVVNIKLDGYPYQQFGIVKGVVTHISLVPKNEQYAIKINLPQGLNTTYNRKIEFKQEMSGTAEIITDNRRILERFLSPFRALAKYQ